VPPTTPRRYTTRYEGESDADITYAPATPGAFNWLAHVSGTSLGVGTGLLADAQVRADANQTPAEVTAMSAADRASYLAILTQCQLTMPDLQRERAGQACGSHWTRWWRGYSRSRRWPG